MSTLKLEHIAHIDNAGPDISIDTNGHLNIVNGSLQMGGVTMLDASNGDLSTGNNASVNIRDAAGEVAGRIRNWSSPTNSIAIESDPSNSAAGSYLTFTVDGAQKMTILGNNVGIGTTSPSAPLTIGSGATSRGSYSDLLIAPGGDNAQIEMWGANTSFAISHFDNDRLGIYSNVSGSWSESRGINIKADGNVGIGTTSPFTRAVVGGGSGTEVLTIFSGSNGEGQIRFADGSSGSAAYQGRVEYDHVNGRLNLGAGGTTPFTLNSSGNVGIGTTNPLTKLHAQVSNVSGYTSVQNDGIVIERTGGTAALNIATDVDQTGAIWFGDATDADAGGIFYQHNADRMIFRVAAGSRVKINSQGVIEGASDAEIKTSPIRKHSNTISTNTTIDSSENAIASGPISVATGVTLTINGNMTVV